MTALDTRPTTGQHRWDKGGPVDHLGRRIVTNPVPADYWPEGVPSTRTTDTARIDPAQVRAASQQPEPEPEPEPADLGQVLAEIRAALTPPADPATPTGPAVATPPTGPMYVAAVGPGAAALADILAQVTSREEQP